MGKELAVSGQASYLEAAGWRWTKERWLGACGQPAEAGSKHKTMGCLSASASKVESTAKPTSLSAGSLGWKQQEEGTTLELSQLKGQRKAQQCCSGPVAREVSEDLSACRGWGHIAAFPLLPRSLQKP